MSGHADIQVNEGHISKITVKCEKELYKLETKKGGVTHKDLSKHVGRSKIFSQLDYISVASQKLLKNQLDFDKA